jgi:hypothetical protein
VLTWVRIIPERVNSTEAIKVKAAIDASQFVIRHPPIRSFEMELIASVVSENRMIAKTSDVRMNRA